MTVLVAPEHVRGARGLLFMRRIPFPRGSTYAAEMVSFCERITVPTDWQDMNSRWTGYLPMDWQDMTSRWTGRISNLCHLLSKVIPHFLLVPRF